MRETGSTGRLPGTVVVIGAGVAGATAAETLRAAGFDGHVVIVGEERLRPYVRPPLSKEVLRGDVGDDTAFLHGPKFYDDNWIELRTRTKATAIDRRRRQVTVTTGARSELLDYDRLLLATGCQPLRLDVPGARLDGVIYLRTLDDARRLHDEIAHAKRVAVVGGGWLGCEAAASAHTMGSEVTLVGRSKLLVESFVGRSVARFVTSLHRQQGVVLRMEREVAAFGGKGRVEHIQLDDGTRVEADVVVVGVGARSACGLAEAAGLPCAGGVIVDGQLRTADPLVYAAGDVAAVRYGSGGARSETVRCPHHTTALAHGALAARNILGGDVTYTSPPHLRSEQFGTRIEMWGQTTDGDEQVIRGEMESGRFAAFWRRDGRVVAGLSVNGDGSASVEALVGKRSAATAGELADAGLDLAVLARPAGSMG